MEAPELLRGRKARWPVPRARGEARRSVVPLVNPKDLTVSRYEHTCGPPDVGRARHYERGSRAHPGTDCSLDWLPRYTVIITQTVRATKHYNAGRGRTFLAIDSLFFDIGVL